jgi:hypothetical protein
MGSVIFDTTALSLQYLESLSDSTDSTSLNLMHVPFTPLAPSPHEQDYLLENTLDRPTMPREAQLADKNSSDAAAGKKERGAETSEREDEAAGALKAYDQELAARLPLIITQLAVLKKKTQLTKALTELQEKELVLYGNRHSVKEPDLAFIFLTNSDNGLIRSLLIPSPEGWVDFHSGNIVTEEGGRFYERAPDASSALKWWLHNIEPTWVELQQQQLVQDRNKKRVGW